jgi:hypothetical protein
MNEILLSKLAELRKKVSELDRAMIDIYMRAHVCNEYGIDDKLTSKEFHDKIFLSISEVRLMAEDTEFDLARNQVNFQEA